MPCKEYPLSFTTNCARGSPQAKHGRRSICTQYHRIATTALAFQYHRIATTALAFQKPKSFSLTSFLVHNTYMRTLSKHATCTYPRQHGTSHVDHATESSCLAHRVSHEKGGELRSSFPFVPHKSSLSDVGDVRSGWPSR